jgi:hypothetical protein
VTARCPHRSKAECAALFRPTLAVGDQDQLAAGRPSIPPLIGTTLLHAFSAVVILDHCFGFGRVWQRLNFKKGNEHVHDDS